MTILYRLALLLLCAFCAPAAMAADTSAVVEAMQKTYAAMDSFRAGFTQELLQRESGMVQKRKGTILFRKPMLLRWETDQPHPELLMVTEKEIWNYLPDEELAYRYSRQLAEDSRSLIQVITGQSPLSRDFDVERVKEEGDGGLVHLLLFPKEATTEMTEAQVWIDPATSLLRRVMIMDFYGNTNTISLHDIVPDAPAGKGSFSFVPPAGVEVEDHLDPMHPMQKALRD